MTIAAFLALIAASLGAYITLLAWRLRGAPGLRDQGWFALVAATGSAFTALNAATTSPDLTAGAVVWAAKAQLLTGGLHGAGWLLYGSAFLGRDRRWVRPLALACAAAGAAMLLPGIGFTGEVSMRPVGYAGVIYRDAQPSAAGLAALSVIVAALLASTARFAAAWSRGVPHAAVHALALSLLFPMAAWDALNLAGFVHGIYLLDLGFLVPVAAVTYALSARVVEESRALAALRARLEAAVAARTLELTRSQEALLRAEKLAALGQFSAGVSHEVSSPASVVASNLHYLEESLGEGQLPPDAAACLAESRQAVERISRLTRQLLDASRFASAPSSGARRARLAEVARAALAAAGDRLHGHRVELAVDPGLEVEAPAELLGQVLDRLLDNAARSLRPGRPGRVTLRAERADGRIRLVVEDEGAGMNEETLRRAFDPFFSTRPFGGGTGMGLAVARGLVQSMRGELRLESEPGRGTRAIVELVEAGDETSGAAGATPAA